jgi:C4-dicarboxylate-specific signal transduction histidine kinase
MEELDAVISAIDDIVFEVNQEGRFTNVWTNKPEKLFFPREKLLAKTVTELMGETAAHLHAAILQTVSLERPCTLEYPSPGDPSQFFQARLVYRRKRNGEGSVLIVVRDISEKKKMEEQAQLQRENYMLGQKSLEEFFDVMPAAVIWLDHQLRYKKANRIFAQAMGLEPEALIGREFGFSQFQSGKKIRQFLHELLASPETKQSLETVLEDGYGGLRIFQLHAQKIGDLTCPDIALIAVDVDQQRKTEKLLEAERIRGFHSARLVSLGEMAGGIAHEIKNPLSIISGNIELARREVERGGSSQEVLVKLEKAHQTVHRIARIVDSMTRLSRFSDRDEFRWEPLSQVLEDAVTLCQQKIDSRKIHFRWLRDEDPRANIFCLREQVAQIIVNFITNAIDAVAVLPSPQITLSVRQDEQGWHIEVRDNGPGVQQENKLFNPFYTTKEPGTGTGLGLSISLKIAQSHEGMIHYQREEGLSVFSLILPHRTVRL